MIATIKINVRKCFAPAATSGVRPFGDIRVFPVGHEGQWGRYERSIAIFWLLADPAKVVRDRHGEPHGSPATEMPMVEKIAVSPLLRKRGPQEIGLGLARRAREVLVHEAQQVFHVLGPD